MVTFPKRKYSKPVCVYFDRNDVDTKDLVWDTINDSEPGDSGVWNVIRGGKVKKYIYRSMEEEESQMTFQMYTISKEEAEAIEKGNNK